MLDTQRDKLMKCLEKNGYLDIYRIAAEIEHFLDKKSNLNLDTVISRLDKDEPYELIIGYKEVNGKNYKVTENTLIPRLETLELIEIVVERLKQLRESDKSTPVRIVEIGTGTGVIIGEIYRQTKHIPNLQFIASDISTLALEVAEINLKDTSIQLIESNLFKNYEPGFISSEVSTIFVSNPPYISQEEYEGLDTSVKEFEPKLALVSPENGADHTLRLIRDIFEKFHLIDSVFIESAPNTIELLKTYSFPVRFDIIKDFRNQERFLQYVNSPLKVF